MNDMRFKTGKVLHGNCVEQMRKLDDCSVDSIVTDPPYGINLMGKAWDGKAIAEAAVSGKDHTKTTGRSASMHAGRYDVSLTGNKKFQVWTEAWAREALRVLKPGGHLLVFGSTRTYHRMAAGIEDAGFEIRDSIHWMFGSGFPKSLDVSKAIDKKATDEAKRWEGWGTALKPAHEPVVVARKPLDGTVAGNMLAHGTGALNIDGCRVDKQDGRWPANIVLDGAAADALDQQSGVSKSQGGRIGKKEHGSVPIGGSGTYEAGDPGYGDSGGASRFFTQADFGPDDWPFVYQAKPSKRERNAGLEDANVHPTVKPVALMRHLVRLVTPPGGVVLDPFLGSGTTAVAAILEGFTWVGCEMTDEYLPIVRGRVQWAEKEASKGKQLTIGDAK